MKFLVALLAVGLPVFSASLTYYVTDERADGAPSVSLFNEAGVNTGSFSLTPLVPYSILAQKVGSSSFVLADYSGKSLLLFDSSGNRTGSVAVDYNPRNLQRVSSVAGSTVIDYSSPNGITRVTITGSGTTSGDLFTGAGIRGITTLNGLIYAAGDNGTVYVLNQVDGSLVTSIALGADRAFRGLTSDGSRYVYLAGSGTGSDTGFIWQLDSQNRTAEGVSTIISGLAGPNDILYNAGRILIPEYFAGDVASYDLSTKNLSKVITGLVNPTGLAIANAPEPSTMALLGLGLVAGAGLLRRLRGA